MPKKEYKDIKPGDKIYFFSAGMRAVDGCPAIRSHTCRGTAHSLMPADSHNPPCQVWFVQWQGCTIPVGEEDFRGFLDKKGKPK
jgi:hypothetical protein